VVEGTRKLNPRILFVSAADWAFRTNRFSLAKWLVERGAKVGVICPEGNLQKEFAEAGLEVFPISFSREHISILGILRAAKSIRQISHQFNADVLHCVSVRCVLLGWLALWGTRIKPRIINHIIGMGSVFSGQTRDLKSKCLRKGVGLCLRQAFKGQGVINVFQNRDDELMWRKKANLKKNQWARLPGSIAWKEASMPEPKTDCFRILFVGRMLEDKGVRELIEAWCVVKAEDVSVELVLCGDVDSGNPTSLSLAEINTLTNTPGCRWLGRCENVMEQMAKANLVVLPSYREGLPRVILEAGLANRAVITTDVPGCREVVEHGRSGLIVPAQNVNALVNAIRELRRNETKRLILARGLSERVKTKFSDEVNNPRWWELYTRTLG
jgi:glycosyltransferase involved in cell wall biosynthesis